MARENGVSARPGGAVSLRVGQVAIAVVLVVCAVVFLALLRQVWDGGSVAFDHPVMMWIHGAATPWLTDAVQVVTHLRGQDRAAGCRGDSGGAVRAA